MNSKRGFVRCEYDAKLDTEALRLRSEGLTYQDIGHRMNCHKSTAMRRCGRALAEIPRDTAANFRKLEDMRLDEMSRILWPMAEAGSFQAIDRLLAIAKRRAKLWGLDAPSRTWGEAAPKIAGIENDCRAEKHLEMPNREHDIETRAKASVRALVERLIPVGPGAINSTLLPGELEPSLEPRYAAH